MKYIKINYPQMIQNMIIRNYKEYAKKEIEIDPFFFNKMINSKNKIPMNEKYREIADKYLVL